MLTLEDFRFLFFSPSQSSQAAGERFWERRHQRTIDVDPPTSQQTMQAQMAAIVDWKQPHGEPFAELKTITQPTLVVNGRRDIMVPTINSYHLAQNIPGAQLIVYPDSGHASLFQYPGTVRESRRALPRRADSLFLRATLVNPSSAAVDLTRSSPQA